MFCSSDYFSFFEYPLQNLCKIWFACKCSMAIYMLMLILWSMLSSNLNRFTIALHLNEHPMGIKDYRLHASPKLWCYFHSFLLLFTPPLLCSLSLLLIWNIIFNLNYIAKYSLIFISIYFSLILWFDFI